MWYSAPQSIGFCRDARTVIKTEELVRCLILSPCSFSSLWS